MSGDEIGFMVELDTDLKRLVDADARTNKEVTHAALWREFGGERKAAIDMRIEHMERREQMVRSEMEDLEEELAQIESEKQALVNKRNEMQTVDEKYEEDVNELLSDLVEGDLESATAEHKRIREIAEGQSRSAEDVVEDAKELAAKQDRRIYNTQFMTPMEQKRLSYEDKSLIADSYGGADE